MCGIIGITGRHTVAPLLIDGLRRLEYRGYDSAGIATLVNGEIQRRRAEGKLINLDTLVEKRPIDGLVGIGHTRWATHGRPNEINAHPHADKNVVLVHNGIIENFQELRQELTDKGHHFETDTDTEAIVHLVSSFLTKGNSPQDSVSLTLSRLEGAFSLAILFAGYDGLIIGARRGSPLAVGYGECEMYLGSDAIALAPLTQNICYLEEGDWVELLPESAVIHDNNGTIVNRPICQSSVSEDPNNKGNFEHFMLKEIYEQPTVIGDTLNTLFNPWKRTVTLPELTFNLGKISRITIIACGTSFHAGLVAKYWFEKVSDVPVECDLASEFRYREARMPKDGLAIFVSQSGETADTLAALRYAKSKKQHTLALVNVAESSMAREADSVLLTLAGPEIGVASTKAFTTQLTVLACLVVATGITKKCINNKQAASYCRSLIEIPARVNDVLSHDQKISDLAREVAVAKDVLYLGRGTGFPIALEGALKLKEISYIHAEGYAAGEMKHGPIALIEDNVPVIVIAPSDELFEKTASNMQEVIARGGRVIFLSDKDGIKKLGRMAAATIEVPTVDSFVAPILYTIPVQLLAYHTALIKGSDVDQPRNLAKSVTVE